MKKIAIVQSNYIPWKGYFDIIAAVDEFILYDDTQYTRRDWRNRNLIKTPQGEQWLTIPVEVKGRYLQKICETRIGDPSWRQNHWRSLRANYAKAQYFSFYEELFQDLYLGSDEIMLSNSNFAFMTAICKCLGIETAITWSMDYEVDGNKTDRLLALCKAAGATHYLSGPSAREYIDADRFERENIVLEYIDYSGYPEYPQLNGEFLHRVSILDLLFNTGPDAAKFMKNVRVRINEG
ncbi:MAG: WbqC family protein [Parvibaculum sp.]|uniref:WbqC family protein n=1 Tax=Parvibaculum sp. TaxID=2024848 RepID=UPI00284F0612|nr:WbqC family protein [Parvibaculum sp.]MDR3497831.1 WbqC family protein [Parvibaculum sp.]